jgi:hypothetical protein
MQAKGRSLVKSCAQEIQREMKSKGMSPAERAPFALPSQLGNVCLAGASVDWGQWTTGEGLLKLAAPWVADPSLAANQPPPGVRCVPGLVLNPSPGVWVLGVITTSHFPPP